MSLPCLLFPFPFKPPWTDLSCLSSAKIMALPGTASKDVSVKGMLQAASWTHWPPECEGKCWGPPEPLSRQASAGERQLACWEWIWVLKGCTSTFQFVHKSPCSSIIWQLACLGLIFNPQVGGRSLRISSLLELFSLHKGST